jgi:hypothetical protein
MGSGANADQGVGGDREFSRKARKGCAKVAKGKDRRAKRANKSFCALCETLAPFACKIPKPNHSGLEEFAAAVRECYFFARIAGPTAWPFSSQAPQVLSGTR